MQNLSLDYFNLPQGQKYHIYRIGGSEVSEQPHTHSFYQICYVDRGEIQHWSEDTCVDTYFGDAFIVPPGFVHRIVFPNEDSQIYSLSFDETMFHRGFPYSDVYRFMTAIKLDASEEDRINIRMKVMLNQDQRYIIRSLMESLLRESASACPPELSSAASLIAAVLCILSQGYFMDAQRSETYRMIDHYSQSLEACVEFIDTHF